MERYEKWLTILFFGLFGCIALAIFGRLVYLQGSRSLPNRESVAMARNLYDGLPAPRGAIVDRLGRQLAYDRPVLGVRAEFHARVDPGTKRIPDDQIDYLATRLASHLMAGQGENGSRTLLRQKLASRIRAARHKLMPSRNKLVDYLKADFLVMPDLDSYEVTRRLRGEAESWMTDENLPGLLYLHFQRTYERTYPYRDATYGPVGNYYIAEQRPVVLGGRPEFVVREAFSGLEACSGLWPRTDEGQSFYSLDFKDARRRRFWTGLGKAPPQATVIHSTLDIDLQVLAHEELRKASDAVTEQFESPYEWGALVLVEVATGEVLALASHYPGRTTPGPFAPIENRFEPGSVVKPLLIGLALQRGDISWTEEFDCSPTMEDFGRPVDGHPRRIIKDDHPSALLTPHGIITNSSNIGAVKVGARLGRAGLKEYLARYGFGRQADLGIPNEVAGGQPAHIDMDKMSDRMLGRFTGPSLSFGYELNVTAVQLARAYLRLLSGRERELRLVSSAEIDGKRVTASRKDKSASRFLSPSTVELVVAAMREVVSADDRATGRHLYAMIDELGYEQPIVGGKTGTSDSGIGGVRAKTATFVGFAPAEVPRYLVVCVFRKDRATRFYGGSYAAPAAGRLLLGALDLERENRQPQTEQVRAWTGSRGVSSVKFR